MQVFEIIIISIIGAAAVAAFVVITIRSIKGKGTCHSAGGACSSCSVTTSNGCAENDCSSSLNKSGIKRK